MKKLPFHLVFFLILGIFFVMNLLSPVEEISHRENRRLRDVPSFTIAGFTHQQFQSAFEQAGNDQFYLRDGFIKVQRALITHLGIAEIQNVWIGQDQLFQKPVASELTMYETLATQMNEFSEAHADLSFDFLLVPTQATILQEQFSASELLQGEAQHMKWFTSKLSKRYSHFDTVSPFKDHKKMRYYYKGDHHWTTLGAYTMFEAWREDHGLASKEEYIPTIINDAFYGTLSNQSGVDLKDRVEVYVPKQNDVKAIVTYVEEQKKTASVYEQAKQYSANPYDIFFGGNHARIDIDTTAKSDHRLIIIKDSYANCFIPFLLPYYQSITIIDPRYFYDSLSDIITERSIDEVMFLYNANTFFSDSSLSNLLQEELAK